MGQQHPLRTLGVRRGHADQFEVDRVVVVHDQQAVFAVDDGVLHVVFDAVAARPDHGELAGRVGRGEQPGLGGHARPGLDQQELAAAGDADAHPEPFVRFVEHLAVDGCRRADLVPPDGVRPPGVVDRGVEEVAATRIEQGALGRVLDLVGEVLPGGQVAHPDRVPLVALGVDGVEQPAPVGAHVEAAEGVEIVPGRFGVVVEQLLLAREPGRGRVAVGGDHRRLPVVRPGDRGPAVDAVLLPLDRAGVVPPPALAHGHTEVGLLGAALELLEELLPQQFEVGGAGIRVVVLGAEMGEDGRVILVAQPLVVVDVDVVVVHPPGRFLRRKGRNDHWSSVRGSTRARRCGRIAG